MSNLINFGSFLIIDICFRLDENTAISVEYQTNMTSERDAAIIGFIRETTFGSVAGEDDIAKLVALLSPS